MSTLATATPAGNVLTFAFPVALFVGIVVWGYFQRTRR
jgi:hypothetical protein